MVWPLAQPTTRMQVRHKILQAYLGQQDDTRGLTRWRHHYSSRDATISALMETCIGKVSISLHSYMGRVYRWLDLYNTCPKYVFACAVAVAHQPSGQLPGRSLLWPPSQLMIAPLAGCSYRAWDPWQLPRPRDQSTVARAPPSTVYIAGLCQVQQLK